MWSCLKYNTRLLTLPAPLHHVPCSYVMLQDPTLHPQTSATTSSRHPVTLAQATAAARRAMPLAKMQEQEMEEEEDNPLDQHAVMSVG